MPDKKNRKKQSLIIREDPYLEPYADEINYRIDSFSDRLSDIRRRYKSLTAFTSWHKEMGMHNQGEHSLVYREWAPAASALSLTGEFNSWDRDSHPLVKKDNGIWEIELSDSAAVKSLCEGSAFKVHVRSSAGDLDRIPAFIRRVIQDPESKDFHAVYWQDDPAFTWGDSGFRMPDSLRIYEAHAGMATEDERVGSFREFADNILPYIRDCGYNTVQLMAVMEHPYYGSFGYHVSSIYAPSSRFGTPDDLKYLVNKAHTLGLAVIMDLVHSHAVKNINEGLDRFDGSQSQYFHAGSRGEHTLWDSKLYDYGRDEVIRYLLSNIVYWLQEYHFDGFRFDGVTSMLYHHHGHYKSFTHYDMYFNDVDWDAVLYLQLANETARRCRKAAVTIAEEVSGMPGLCRRPTDGGLGFDYRLDMGTPDHWIKLIKEQRDEDWDLAGIFHQLTDRRYGEKSISYAESHDQALVGDKTIAFRLMDSAMYDHMSLSDNNDIISRGMALHKMIRLITLLTGGDAWLNFMGNEFGHPEWIDFPREGNGFSYKYARRQWSLVRNPDLKYHQLGAFDRAMQELAARFGVLGSAPARMLNLDKENHCLVFERAGLICCFNFSPSTSVPAYRIGVPMEVEYSLVLDSDAGDFGGFGRIDSQVRYQSQPTSSHGYKQSIEIYLTSRTVLVLAPVIKKQKRKG